MFITVYMTDHLDLSFKLIHYPNWPGKNEQLLLLIENCLQFAAGVCQRS